MGLGGTSSEGAALGLATPSLPWANFGGQSAPPPGPPPHHLSLTLYRSSVCLQAVVHCSCLVTPGSPCTAPASASRLSPTEAAHCSCLVTPDSPCVTPRSPCTAPACAFRLSPTAATHCSSPSSVCFQCAMRCSDPLNLYRVSAVWRLLVPWCFPFSLLLSRVSCVCSPLLQRVSFSVSTAVVVHCSFPSSVCLERPAPCGCPLEPSRVSCGLLVAALPWCFSPHPPGWTRPG
jgi:hypothetical protein